MTSTPWDRVRCPDCLGALAFATEAWRCTSCTSTYVVERGVPRLIGASSSLNLNEVATQDEASEAYDNVRYQREWSRRYHEHTLDQLFDIVPARGDVLDDGCGPGLFMEHMRTRAPQMGRYVGIDVSGGMLGKAVARRTDPDRELLIQADSCRLPFADASFDTVFVRGLLHHLPDPEQGVREVARVLKPGGTALVLEPNKTVISTLPRLLARKGKQFDDDHKNFRASYIQRVVSSVLALEGTHFYGYVAYPLLGYPDVASFDRLLPLDRLAPWLIRIDDTMARVPGVRGLGWGVILRASRRRDVAVRP